MRLEFEFVLRLCAALLGVLALTSRTGADDVRVSELVAGITARAHAIVSGHLRYRHNWGFRHLGEHHPERDIDFLFSGSSWRAEWISTNVGIVHGLSNHDGAFLNYNQVPQKDASIWHNAVITPSKAYTKAEEFEPFLGPPTFAGSFFHETSAEYVQNHASEARLVGSAMIDGYETTVLEWEVPRDLRHKAFRGAGKILADGGILRVHVAQELGYALPRIEHLSRSGQITDRYSARDFSEVAPGIYLPAHCEWQGFKEDGRPGSYMTYDFEVVERINEPIADDEFVISVPGDTYVLDKRDPLQTINFRAHQAAKVGYPDDLENVVDFGAESPGGGGWLVRSWKSAVVVGVNVGILALVGYYFWRRRFGARKA